MSLPPSRSERPEKMRGLQKLRLFLFDLNAWIRMNKRGLKTDPQGLVTDPVEIRKRMQAAKILESRAPYDCVLDLGCAAGRLTCEIAPLAKKILALDISHTALWRAKYFAKDKRISNIEFIQGSLRRWESPQRFDLIVASEVLYSIGRKHSEEAYQRLLDKISSWIKPAGFLYLANACTNETDKENSINIRESFERRGFRILHEEYFERYSLLTLLRHEKNASPSPPAGEGEVS